MSQSVRIGAQRIADHTGTHEPDEEIDNPSVELVALANAGTVDPESGKPYCTLVGAPPAPTKTPAPAPADTEKAPS